MHRPVNQWPLLMEYFIVGCRLLVAGLSLGCWLLRQQLAPGGEANHPTAGLQRLLLWLLH
jgi:hypothetical protein